MGIKDKLPTQVRGWLRTHATHPDREVRRQAWQNFLQWWDHQRGVLL
jgi:oligoendopeptidase F